MRVSYKISGSETWVTLFDQAQGAKVVMPEFKGSVKFAVMTSQGFGAQSQSITPMGNALTNLPWKFGIGYDSFQLAKGSIRQMALLGSQRFHLQVTQDGDTDFYPNATATSYDFEQTGSFVWHTFVFEAQLVTATQPT